MVRRDHSWGFGTSFQDMITGPWRGTVNTTKVSNATTLVTFALRGPRFVGTYGSSRGCLGCISAVAVTNLNPTVSQIKIGHCLVQGPLLPHPAGGLDNPVLMTICPPHLIVTHPRANGTFGLVG